jgi:hypothetical protein
LRATIGPELEIVRVIGWTGSQGWSAPQLVATFAGKPLDDILDLQFIATMPSQSQKAEGFVGLGAVFALEECHPFKGVRVARRSPDNRASFAKRIFPRCCGGSSRLAASEASRTIRTGSI